MNEGVHLFGPIKLDVGVTQPSITENCYSHNAKKHHEMINLISIIHRYLYIVG